LTEENGITQGIRQHIRRVLLDYYVLARSCPEEKVPITGKLDKALYSQI